MLKHLFLAVAGAMTLSSCMINDTIQSLQANRDAIDMSTQAIYENIQAIESANRNIEENRRQIESLNAELRQATK